MTGLLHNVSTLDSVRIEEVGATRAVQIPCGLILDIDTALKWVRELGDALIVYRDTNESYFAECGGHFYGKGATPFQAIANMRKTGTRPCVLLEGALRERGVDV